MPVLTPLQLVAILAMFCYLAPTADAVAASRTGTRGNVKLPSRGQKEDTPDFVAQPFDSVYFQWELTDDFVGNTLLVGQFNFTQNQWMGIGFNSNKRMNGPIVICYADALNGTARCDDYFGVNFELNPPLPDFNEGATRAIAAELDEDGAGYIKFQTVVRQGPNMTLANGSVVLRPNVTDTTLIDFDGFARTIFAIGGWDLANDVPKQERTDDRESMLINFVTGKKKKLNSKTHRIAIYVTCGVFAAVLIAAFIDRRRVMPRSHNVRRIYGVILVSLYLGCLALYIALNYIDYTANVVGKAIWRAVGDGTAFALSSLLFPVGKRILFSDLLTVSHERAVKYHAFAACMFIGLGTAHGLAMWYYYGTESIKRWRNKDTLSHLPGPIAIGFAVLVVVPALLRHFFWRYWRLLHYMYLLVFFFAILHYPKLAFGIAPGASLHLLIFITRKFLKAEDVDQNLDSAHFDEEAGIVTLDFVKSEVVMPGQWFLINLPEISRMEQHPFAVAKMILLDDCQTIAYRFMIRVRGPGSWTRRVAEMIKQKAQLDRSVFKKFQITGPFGQLEVNPINYRHILFVSGGIGITPHLYFLQQLLINEVTATGESKVKLSVSLVWVVRELALLECLAHDLLMLKQSFADAYPALKLSIQIHFTGNCDGAQYIGSTPISKGVIKGLDVQRGRPDLKTVLPSLLDTVKAKTEALEILPADSDKPLSGGDTEMLRRAMAVYLSGPPGLMGDAASACSSSSAFNCHLHLDNFRL